MSEHEIQNGVGGCCICCKPEGKTCYCGCCPCVPDGDLTFSVYDCSISYGGASYECSSCADGWTFTLSKRDTECIVHTVGIPDDGYGAVTCSPCDETEYRGASTVPAGATYNEAWGFSGTVCGDCNTTDPPFESSNCDGMALRASLCCCKTGIPESSTEYTTDDHPCPMDTASNCTTITMPCSMECFWFVMSTWEKYDIDPSPGKDSPCSRCAAVQPAYGPLVPGELFGGAGKCFTITSYTDTEGGLSQCKSPSSDPPKPFMLGVEASFPIACDCQTGLVGYGYGGVITSYSPVQMTIKALITE